MLTYDWSSTSPRKLVTPLLTRDMFCFCCCFFVLFDYTYCCFQLVSFVWCVAFGRSGTLTKEGLGSRAPPNLCSRTTSTTDSTRTTYLLSREGCCSSSALEATITATT